MPSGVGPQCRVLIVDDNADLLESLIFALRAAGGFVVETATSGILGLERAVMSPPDCMVIDIKMPEVDGLQLIRTLRGDPQTASIPLVILSALVQVPDQTMGMLAGADQYLTKPTSPQVLIDAIRRAISLGEAERQRHLRALLTDAEEEDGL